MEYIQASSNTALSYPLNANFKNIRFNTLSGFIRPVATMPQSDVADLTVTCNSYVGRARFTLNGSLASAATATLTINNSCVLSDIDYFYCQIVDGSAIVGANLIIIDQECLEGQMIITIANTGTATWTGGETFDIRFMLFSLYA